VHALLVPLLALLGASPSAAARPAPTSGGLKIATLVPEGTIWDKSLRRLSEECRARTDGRVSFRIYPGGVAGDESDMLRKMRIGQLSGAVLTLAGLGDIDRSVQVFQIPLFLRSEEEARDLLQCMDATFRKRLEAQGYVLVHWVHAGWLNFFSTRPVHTVDDLRALKQFVWTGDGRLARWYEEAGFRPVSLAATDVLTGLQTGMIECLPSPPLAAVGFQWYRSAGYMLDYPVSPLFGAVVLTKGAWDKLSAADQTVLLERGREAEAFLMEQVPAQEAEAVRAMQARGLVVTEPEPGRGTAPWLELSRHFASRMSKGWVAPEVQAEVDRCLEQFRSRQEPAPSDPAPPRKDAGR
jgi:TRAP-type transport system periplasmic protein